MGLFGSEVFEDQDSIASGELRGKGGEQRVGFLSVGELRTMALARARARKWCDLTFRTLTSLSGVPLAKMPAVEPLGGMAKEMRKLSVVEMRQKGMEKNVHITNRDSLVSALAGAQIPASENTRIPIVPGRIPSTPSSKTSRRGKKSIRKLTKPRSSPAESGDGVRELTEKLKTGLDLNVAEDKQDQENPEIIMCRNWLSWYFTCEQQQFRKRRDEFSTVLFTIFDYNVTGSNLGDRVSLEWNKRFNTTAGMTHFRMKKISKDRYAGIVLSTKVLDSPLKLYRTLAHEMCHAAQWVIDGKPKPPHGAPFKKWVKRFRMFDPSLDITTCHQYDIEYRYKYECEACRHTYGRHSKSIDVNRKVCGNCRGKLRLLPGERKARRPRASG